MSDAAAAVAYAENQLGIHYVYSQATDARGKLDKVLTELGEERDKLRDRELRLTDAEMAIIADERGKHPEMSATAMDKHLKLAFNDSADVRGLREEISKIKGDIEGLEFDKSMYGHDIEISCARMNQLGGYLQYLAVIKDVANRKEFPDAT